MDNDNPDNVFVFCDTKINYRDSKNAHGHCEFSQAINHVHFAHVPDIIIFLGDNIISTHLN